jgi:hypothetical protein
MGRILFYRFSSCDAEDIPARCHKEKKKEDKEMRHFKK